MVQKGCLRGYKDPGRNETQLTLQAEGLKAMLYSKLSVSESSLDYGENFEIRLPGTEIGQSTF